MRKTFQRELLKLMEKDKNVWLIVGDLGYGMFDDHFSLYPERTINMGASEQAMMGAAVGLALSGKLPFVYSITPFLLYRPMETIRNYIDHERAKVILVGSGRDKDYELDGFSHHTYNLQIKMMEFNNIMSYFPDNKKEIPRLMRIVCHVSHPSFISLKR